MRYPKDKITGPNEGTIRWTTRKDKSGNAMMKRAPRERKARQVAAKKRRINRQKGLHGLPNR